MPTIAKSSFGVQLKIGDGGGIEVFTTIAEVRDVSGPQFALGTEEVTAHDGTGWRESVSTLKDGGDITFDLNFNNAATQTALYTDFANATRRNFQLVIPTTVPKTLAFAAFVTGFEMGLPVEGAITASVTLSITNTVTWS